jgi:hypothetical protein
VVQEQSRAPPFLSSIHGNDLRELPEGKKSCYETSAPCKKRGKVASEKKGKWRGRNRRPRA